ncbi:hypothetical protein evm_006721 [Chilo suppressalis]|nr:hypothetical protein evm_006721 [Chilo suppressalis]
MWLTTKNITFEPNMVKATLIDIVKQQNHTEKYAVDEIAAQKGIRLLRPPPYHCELNPIELVWAQALDHISERGTSNLVEFKAKKTQACAFTAKPPPFLPLPSLQGTTLPLQSNIFMLGMEVCSDLNPKKYIETVIKTASRILGVLNKVRRFFTPDQLCLLYKTQVRSCVEYCSQLWDGSAKYLLDALDRLQRRAIRIIGDEEKCNIDGCQFVAHPKVVTKHIQMQHASGLYKKISNLNNPEDIQKWREERKRKYPTKNNIEKKAAECKEKVERGEKMGLKHNKNNRTFNSAGKRKSVFNEDNLQKRQKLNSKNSTFKKQVKKILLPKKIENIIPSANNFRTLRPFAGIQDIVMEFTTEENGEEIHTNVDIEDDDDISNIQGEVDKTGPKVCSALSALMFDYDSPEEEFDEVKSRTHTVSEEPPNKNSIISKFDLACNMVQCTTTKASNQDKKLTDCIVSNEKPPVEITVVETNYSDINHQESGDEGPEEIKVFKTVDLEINNDENKMAINNNKAAKRVSSMVRQFARCCAIRIQFCPATLVMSSDHLAGCLPTFLRPVLGRHSTIARLHLSSVLRAT